QPTSSGTRSCTQGSGRDCTTATRARRESSSGGRSPTSTSRTRSRPETEPARTVAGADAAPATAPYLSCDSFSRHAHTIPTPKGAEMTVNTQAPTLRLALLPRGGLLTDALLVCAGAGLIAGSAQISFKLPFTPVPITGQTFSVLLVGASLGMFRGGASALLYVLLGLVFPVYAGQGEGWDVTVGASGGYLVS